MGAKRVLAVLALAALLAPSAAHAFKPGIHEDISEEALRAVSTTVDGGRTITFTDDAIDDVRDANFFTDVGPGFFVGENHFTEELFTASSSRLVNLRNQVISLSIGDRCDDARQRLGTAYHTLQDFYAHSNWIERGMSGINGALGNSVLANPSPAIATCPGDPEVLAPGGGSIVTTAYYIGLLGCGPIPIAGKCYHGGPGGCDGIHKDNPGRPFHFEARARAVEASRVFVESILQDGRMASNDDAKKCLLGVRSGTLGMVIDDTGSMGPEISAVKAQVGAIVNSVVDTDDEPEQYLLVRFGDPDVGPPFETPDAGPFLGAVNSLFASGGGDCPELAFTGLLQAVARSKRDSSLFLFTDASSKDALLAPAVIAAALIKQVRITPLLTGSCSPIDPGFVAVAEQTGGQLFFLSPFELGQVFDLVAPQLHGDFVTVARAQRTLAGGTVELPVPIDATMERAIFSLSATDPVTLGVLDPDGQPVLAGQPGVTVRSFTGGRLVGVEAPRPGLWRVVLGGTGQANVAVQGNSPLRFPTFELVELVNPIHEALAPLAGQPVLGATTTALAALRGPFAEVGFELLDTGGDPIQPLDLELGNEHAALDEYVGSAVLPTQPFRVAAVGLDEEGNAFRRLFPPIFRVQPIEVRVVAGTLVEALPVGATTTLAFTVTNHGAPGFFAVSAAEANGFVAGVGPTLLDLGTGESAEVEVDLFVPAGTDPSTIALLTVSATSTANPAVGNSTAVELPVGGGAAPDCGAAEGTSIALWPPNHRMEAIDLATALAAVTAPGGAPVTFTVAAITQDEPLLGTGSGDTAPDGAGVGEGVAQVRVERAGKGNGRVYEVGFTASSGGGACDGSFHVTVPLGQNGEPAVDDGQAFDSTAP